MGRVFVISGARFPRGGAAANYLQYLGQALQCAGYETYLLCDLNPEYLQPDAPLLQWNGLTVCPVRPAASRLARYWQARSGFAGQRAASLRQFGIGKQDTVVVLGEEKTLLLQLLRLRRQYGFKIIGGQLEMFAMEDFPPKRRRWRYLCYRDVLENVYPRFDAIMGISTFIARHYAAKGIKSYCVPILADCAAVPLPHKAMDKVRFIIPANGKMKDDLRGMVRGFLALPDPVLQTVELHLCGVTQQDLQRILSPAEAARLRGMMTVHDWMVYDELDALYRRMHFLLLSRGVCQMTQANFPSKVPETMNYGIVPIASDVGDYTKYYLRDGENSLFIPGDGEEACARAIRRALALFPQGFPELSRAARRCVEQKFDYHVWAPTLRAMIEQTAGRGAQRNEGGGCDAGKHHHGRV